ncbi:MAG: CHAT domain-containing protein [Solirubrobacteraceae bacterium]
MPPVVSEYDELKVRIDADPEGAYHVYASTEMASVSGSFELPFAELEVENFILRVSRSRGRRRIEASALGDAKRFGGPLFRALFRDQVNGLYHDALADARHKGHGLRITLCLNGAPELMDVPWEYLFDEPDFLAASALTPVVRYLDLARGHRPLRVEPPLRILGLISSPSDYDRLDVERERSNLERALADLTRDGSVELTWLERPSLSSLLRRLQQDTVHGLHYVGHGSYDERAEEGVLLFEDEEGRGRPVSGDKLGMILHDFTSLRLAVLNACEGARTARSDPFAGVAHSLVRRDIPAVVAMQFEISDEAAIAFAGGFYEALAAGWPADASVAAARLAMLAERSDDIEWGTPVLFMRVPDGRLFELAAPRPRPLVSSTLPAPESPGPSTAILSFDPLAEAIADKRHNAPQGQAPAAAVTGPSAVDAAAAGVPPGSRHDYRRRPRHWWLGAGALVVALAVVLTLALRPSQSNAGVAENWIAAFDAGDYARAATYWQTPGYWTGLKDKTDRLSTATALTNYLRQRAACHKLIEGAVIDNKSGRVALRVYIDRDLPGRQCRGKGQTWIENYQFESGHIIAVSIQYAPGGASFAHGSGSQGARSGSSPNNGSSGQASNTSGSSGSGSTTTSSTPSGAAGTAPSSAAATPSSPATTTSSGTVIAPPTTTAP